MAEKSERSPTAQGSLSAKIAYSHTFAFALQLELELEPQMNVI